MCQSQPLLPMGQHDTPNVSAVKLYCAKCEDMYNPKSTRHASIDGAYFGTSFHNILFQVYPNIMPAKSLRRYEPRVFGFRVHAAAALHRWQDGVRADMQDRLAGSGVEADFVEELGDEYEDESDEALGA
jgi:casein kinase II subunit beta